MSTQTTTMYAIKKAEANGGNENDTTDDGSAQQPNASQSPQQATTNGSSQSAATSVWQKKKRKRGKKNKSNANNNNNDNNKIEDDNNNALGVIDTNKNDIDGVISKSEGDIIIKQTQISALKPGNINGKQKSAPGSYDPKSNPYSMENFKRNAELQQTLTAKAKTKQSSLTGIKLAPKRIDASGDALPIGSTQLTNSASTASTGVNKPGNINTNLPVKSPMSQVRLTPLFPSPQIPNAYNVRTTVPTHLTLNGQPQAPLIHNGHPHIVHEAPVARTYQRLNTQPHHHGHHGHHGHHHGHSVHPTAAHLSPADTDPTQCPHGNLSSEELINIKIRKRNVCYVVGLPIHIATEQKLRSQEWFGQFGNIATIAINRNSKSIQANSIPAHITYDNDISALNAINFCNKFIFDDGRKLKATFGTQHYCRWFIAANKKCTNVFCGFRHSWCRPQDIITQKDINDFKAIPAGAYTSRNIENQPLGVRSSHTADSYNAQHIIPPPQTVDVGSSTVPVYANSYGVSTAAPIDHKEYLRMAASDGISPLDTLTADMSQISAATAPVLANTNNGAATAPITAAQVLDPNTTAGAANGTSNDKAKTNNGTAGASNTEQGGAAKPNLSISADPYTFYLSNSAATPTGPSPISAAAAPAVPNIYDSRHVLMKQIMNRNHSQQVEIDRLTQQIKILSEMEIKNKQEIHKWWTELAQSQQNEKNVKAKYDKLTNDFKSLERKHDDLQIKYLALDKKYKDLQKSKNNESKEFESWDTEDVVKWIMNLDGRKYKKYENDLAKNIKTENIDGQCLESLDKGDLHRLGVTDFKDKKDLLQKIKELVTPKEQ